MVGSVSLPDLHSSTATVCIDNAVCLSVNLSTSAASSVTHTDVNANAAGNQLWSQVTW